MAVIKPFNSFNPINENQKAEKIYELDSQYLQNSLEDMIRDAKRVGERTLIKIYTHIKNRLNQSFPSGEVTRDDLEEILNDRRLKVDKSPEWIIDDILSAVSESMINEETPEDMSYGELERIIDYANMLRDRISEGVTIEPWMQTKISLAKEGINSVFDALDGDDGVVESLNEGKYEVYYSDGVAQVETFDSPEEGLDFMKKEIKRNKKLRSIALYNPGVQSTADTDKVIYWWGDGSYYNNKAKKDQSLAKKKLK